MVEAKDNNSSVGDGIQQAIDYAETLGILCFFFKRRWFRSS